MLLKSTTTITYTDGDKMAKTVDWFDEFKGKQRLTESEVNLLKRRLNDGKVDIRRVRKSGYALYPAQIAKGLKWLHGLHYTSRGAVRVNSPLGYREARILDASTTMRLMQFMNIQSHRSARPFFVPVYTVVSPSQNFDYYLAGGVVHIIG